MNLSILPAMASGTAKFHWPHPENLLLVRATAAGVLVRAAEDNLTPEQQENFIRYLRAEGFITASLAVQDRSGGRALGQERVPARWIIDSPRPEVDPSYALHRRRLSWCTLGFAAVWLAFMMAFIRW